VGIGNDFLLYHLQEHTPNPSQEGNLLPLLCEGICVLTLKISLISTLFKNQTKLVYCTSNSPLERGWGCVFQIQKYNLEL
jgi:hypothetical protein